MNIHLEKNIILAKESEPYLYEITPLDGGAGGGEDNNMKLNTLVYEPLENLPGIQTSEGIGVYLGGMFNLAIGFAAVLAVFMIVLGGFEYMIKEAVPEKLGAMERIKGAMLGLILALVSFLLLKTIDKDLVEFNLNIPVIEVGDQEESIDNTNGDDQEVDFNNVLF